MSEQATITIDVDSLRGDTLPMYCQYPGQHQPQPAYVQMTEDGKVTTTINHNIGGGTPVDVWHNRTLQWQVPANVRGDALADLLESERVRGLLERVHAGHEVDWDGNNHVGTLDEDATKASEELDSIFGSDYFKGGGEWKESDLVNVWSLGDWFGQVSLLEAWPADKSLAQAAKDNEDSLVYDANGYTTDNFETALLEFAESRFDVDEHDRIAAVHVEALLADGRITEEQAAEWKANA